MWSDCLRHAFSSSLGGGSEPLPSPLASAEPAAPKPASSEPLACTEPDADGGAAGAGATGAGAGATGAGAGATGAGAGATGAGAGATGCCAATPAAQNKPSAEIDAKPTL